MTKLARLFTSPGVRKSRKRYDTLSLCAYAVVLAGSWTYAAASFGTSVYAGGMPVLIYGAIGVSVLESLFLVSIAEFASAHPSAGGIPYYSRILAGPDWGRFAEYTVGTMHTIGVCFGPSGALIGMVQLFATAGAVMHPNWVYERWQLMLGYQGANLLVALLIVYMSRALSIMNRIAVIIMFLSLFVVIGFLIGRAATTASNSFVWSQFENRSGFSSNGYCTLLGIGIALYAYGNPHWICSLSDDVENAARAVPIAFVAQQIGNLVTVFAFLVTAGYVITDYDALVESHFPSAIGATFEQALGSQVGAMVLLLLIAVPGLVGLMSYYNVCMMVADAFLRTHSMPGWEWLTRRHPGPNVPLNILYCLTVINLLLGFVYLASAEGFSILLGAPGVLYFAGYLVPLVAHVVTKGKNLGHGGWFKMPRKLSVGLAAFNTLTMLFIVICLCLPRSSPITAANMNWSVLFLVFGIASSIVLWTSYGRSNYEGVDLAVADAIEIEATDTTDAESGQMHKSTEVCQHNVPCPKYEDLLCGRGRTSRMS